MNNESSQVGGWWILIRNLKYQQPDILPLHVLEGTLHSICVLCGPCLAVSIMLVMEPLPGPGWASATGLGVNIAASLMQGQRMFQWKMMGKGESVAISLPSRDYQVLYWIVFILSVVNRSCQFFFLLLFFPNGSFNIPIWDALVSCLQLQEREQEHQSASALSCRELSSVILSELAGEGQRDPKGSPRSKRQARFSQTVLWEGHILGPQFLQL